MSEEQNNAPQAHVEPHRVVRTAHGAQLNQAGIDYSQGGKGMSAPGPVAQGQGVQQIPAQLTPEAEALANALANQATQSVNYSGRIYRDTLANGIVVEMGVPATATQFVLSRLLKDQDQETMGFAYAKALMYVRSINGVPQPIPTRFTELQQMANQLGDDGLDGVLGLYGHYWPPMTPASLAETKKNL